MYTAQSLAQILAHSDPWFTSAVTWPCVGLSLFIRKLRAAGTSYRQNWSAWGLDEVSMASFMLAKQAKLCSGFFFCPDNIFDCQRGCLVFLNWWPIHKIRHLYLIKYLEPQVLSWSGPSLGSNYCLLHGRSSVQKYWTTPLMFTRWYLPSVSYMVPYFKTMTCLRYVELYIKTNHIESTWWKVNANTQPFLINIT